MKPFIKWQGGKRRELPHITPYLDNFKTIAEPFCGGSAVSFMTEMQSSLNDQNQRLINLYRVVASDDYYRLKDDVERFKTLTKDELNVRYYQARDYINLNQSFDDPYVSAREFLFIRQQCFSGMERYNRAGKYNVPHGRYKTFGCCLGDEHHEYLKRTPLTNMNAIDFIKSLDDDAFLFLDPPYLDRAGYETKDGGIHLHAELSILLNTTVKNPWLIVHSDHPFYREAYRNFNIKEVPFKYSQQFNGGDYNSSVNHLYISNF